MNAHIITVGEALVEIMRPGVGQPLDRPGQFEGPFASGAPAIFAVAAARLGLSAGFAGSIGADAFGRLLSNRLQLEGVDITLMREVPGYTTGIAFVAYAEAGGRDFVFHLKQSACAMGIEALDPSAFADVRWLHISGSALFMSQASRDSCAQSWSVTKAAGGKLSLDPNLRPELMPVEQARTVLEPYLEEADLLLPTVEEARTLTGKRDDNDAAAFLMGDRERTVVFKRGRDGCSVWTEHGRTDVAGFSVKEVDPTGAGDCFNAACIYGMERGWSEEKTGRFACAAGALAVTRQGPMEGAPTVSEIEALLER